jgi:pyruvate dehydrogenase E2 component (dihydrolipoamide acetyltransferase)
MANNVLMPKMGYDMEEGKILRWLKNEGDKVAKGEPIAEIETDKVAIEIEAFSAGVLAKILTPAGGTAKVGAPIGIIGDPGEKVDAPAGAATTDAAPAGAAPPQAAAPAPAREAAPDKGTYGAPQGERVGAAPKESVRAAAPAPAPAAGGERIKASPLAKKVAADLGVELAGLTGSGPGGRIVRRDVEEARNQGGAPRAAAPGAQAPSAGGGRKEPLTGMRKAIARRMAEAMAPIPHFYVTMAVDMDAAMALREQINAGREKDAKISVNDMVLKACALALRKHPSLNARWDGDAIFHPDDVSISVAVAIDGGLIAPDVPQADVKSLGAISKEIKDKAGRAKSGHLAPDEYGRGTFTLSNLGMFGVEAFTAIVTPPQSGAIAVGAVTKEAVVRGDQLAVGQVMRFTVSADHRITDGAGSAAFAVEVKRLLENPLQLLV